MIEKKEWKKKKKERIERTKKNILFKSVTEIQFFKLKISANIDFIIIFVQPALFIFFFFFIEILVLFN